MIDSNERPFQFSLKGLLGLFVVVALLLAAGQFVISVIHGPRDAYCLWGTGDLVLSYMEANDGAWPRSWGDLEPIYKSQGSYTMGGTLDTLKKYVNVNFAFDPDAAADEITEETAKPSFRVIWLKNGSDAHFEHREPNQRVFDYLKDRKFGHR